MKRGGAIAVLMTLRRRPSGGYSGDDGAMRILQIVLPDASEYERKSQRADREAFAAQHEVTAASLEEARAIEADVAHLYAGAALPSKPLVGFPFPYVSSAPLRHSRWSLRRPSEPGYLVSPVGVAGAAVAHDAQRAIELLPEAVEDAYFAAEARGRNGATKVIGSFLRRPLIPLIEQVRSRVERFRDDTRWELFDRAPSPEDLATVDAWVDPAVDECDLDGFAAEALVVGLPVVASRTAINSRRLEQGRAGFLTPIGDQNETTHAILTALFKTEVAQQKLIAARQTISRFRTRQRARVLFRMYETLTS